MSLYYNNLPSQGRGVSDDSPPSPGARVRRHPERAAYDRETIDAILDEGLVGHLGLVSDGQPYVMPMLYARAGVRLYLHGSPQSRLLSAVAAGARICFTVTLLDGLVLARSAFRHSLNYRSVVILGQAWAVRDAREKLDALRMLVDHVMTGRAEQVRAPSAPELKVTEVAALDLRVASAKARAGPPADNPNDYSLPVWAGELPLGLSTGAPVPDARCQVPTPPSLRAYSRGRA